MKRGPRPTPTVLKLIRGNPGKRPINKAEPKPKPVRRPRPPIELNADALKEWHRVAGELQKLGILTKLDLAALAAHCVAFSRFKSANEALRVMAAKDPVFEGMLIKTKQGNWIQNPLLGIARRAAADMVQFAVEFGMTPSSRSRVKVSPRNKHNKWTDH